MLSSIFQTERFHSCGDVDDHSLDNLVKQSGFCRGVDQDMDLDLDLDSDCFSCGKSFSADETNQQEHVAFGSTDHLFLDTTRSFSCGDELRKVVADDSQKGSDMIKPGKKGFDHRLPSASFDILKKYGSRCRRLSGENTSFPSYESELRMTCGLSVEMIIQLGAEKFIKSSSQVSDELSVLSHPYASSIMSHSKEDSEGVHLVQSLLSCAEKLDKKQYQQAHELLLECEGMSSAVGTPTQRLVFYFTEALYEKFDRETGSVSPKGLGKKVEDPLLALRSRDETLITFHNELPISQITKFAGVQAVVDNIGEASKVHFIDFEIRKGIQCIILMQALVDRCGSTPIEHLKITAVGKSSEASVKATGSRLVSFARSLGLSFSFHEVMVDDMLDLNADSFEVEAEEVVAVYAEYSFKFLIGQQDRLEHLMNVIRSLSFRVMVVAEVEANCNHPNFVDRFVDSLFFYGAYFEAMADCVKTEEQRFIGESTCFGSSIRNIVATEGEERKIRHARIGVWRSFFTRFGFEESELSMSSVYQANLVVKNFSCGSSFTFGVDGKSLIVGWKGTPMSSVSAWRFNLPNICDSIDSLDSPM
ncbi:hypothetical protein C2S52_014396 [Perilla frutescens var. hirtella]|nr:hypothetical protein C2S52_014396 [Perilla frutescens var. hirtella]